MKKLAASFLISTVLSSSALAASWPGSTDGTTVQWGMNRTVSPYQVGLRIGSSWYPIGTITSGGTWVGTSNPGITGDCTTTGTVITCTKTNNVSFGTGATTNVGTAATVNTGTSGATIPLLSTANTWSLAQTFSSTVRSSGYATSGAFADGSVLSGAVAAQTYLLVREAKPVFANTLSTTECGTAAIIQNGSSNQGGQITFGTFAATGQVACSVKFSTPYPNFAYCTLTSFGDIGAVRMWIDKANTSLPFNQGFRIVFSGNPGAGKSINYSCTGN